MRAFTHMDHGWTALIPDTACMRRPSGEMQEWEIQDGAGMHFQPSTPLISRFLVQAWREQPETERRWEDAHGVRFYCEATKCVFLARRPCDERRSEGSHGMNCVVSHSQEFYTSGKECIYSFGLSTDLAPKTIPREMSEIMFMKYSSKGRVC